jgi:hypothetical protein
MDDCAKTPSLHLSDFGLVRYHAPIDKRLAAPENLRWAGIPAVFCGHNNAFALKPKAGGAILGIIQTAHNE